ncbi:MAG: class II aldolase/adducin family protein [Gammaproteobacteria bacterium]|nr:class II aldolase/adducin family protein [Gammaproteobacteria bacterium]
MSAADIATLESRARERYSDAEWQTRTDLAACYRLIDHFGYSDIVWNHITARVAGHDEYFLINRMGLRYDEITASNLVKLDIEGNVIDGPDEVNVTGFIIHSAIHRKRPDIVCVLHTHTRGGLGVSALKCGLQPMVQDALMFHKRIAYHDYEGFSIDIDERERLAASLGDKYAMIMRNHGLLTAGRTIGEAFMLMYYLERACTIQMDVMATQQKISLPEEAMLAHVAEQYQQFCPGKYEWPALVRLMDKKDPSYRE